MKQITIVLCLCLLLSLSFAALSTKRIENLFRGQERLTPEDQLTNNDVDMLFKGFVLRNEKKYPSEKVYTYRRSIFSDNLERVKKLNSDQNETTYGTFELSKHTGDSNTMYRYYKILGS